MRERAREGRHTFFWRIEEWPIGEWRHIIGDEGKEPIAASFLVALLVHVDHLAISGVDRRHGGVVTGPDSGAGVGLAASAG